MAVSVSAPRTGSRGKRRAARGSRGRDGTGRLGPVALGVRRRTRRTASWGSEAAVTTHDRGKPEREGEAQRRTRRQEGDEGRRQCPGQADGRLSPRFLLVSSPLLPLTPGGGGSARREMAAARGGGGGSRRGDDDMWGQGAVGSGSQWGSGWTDRVSREARRGFDG
ncbi:hypothetical protein BDA96_02G038600 [Sorghum bicolor]|uniref:Uncharacterized protein n=1 Tax=Sorghum bicolor TaxID=4558 RepID=A0A921RJZ3_SORBI|nr:hypothetical protein BDA96_02G038600 [Sorghum bicolor]